MGEERRGEMGGEKVGEVGRAYGGPLTAATTVPLMQALIRRLTQEDAGAYCIFYHVDCRVFCIFFRKHGLFVAMVRGGSWSRIVVELLYVPRCCLILPDPLFSPLIFPAIKTEKDQEGLRSTEAHA